MRETLWRGRIKRSNRWVYGDLVQLSYSGHMEYYIGNSDEEVRVEDASLGEFTGLKDKNGERIFENDILRDNLGDDLTVLYIDGGFKAQEREGVPPIPIEYIAWRSEVVGNTLSANK